MVDFRQAVSRIGYVFLADGLKNRSEKTTECHVDVVAIRSRRRRPPSSLRSNGRAGTATAKYDAAPAQSAAGFVALRLARA